MLPSFNTCLLCRTNNASDAKACSYCHGPSLYTRDPLARTAVHWAEYRINRQAGLSRDGDLSEIARNALEFLTMTESSFVHIKTDVQDVLLHWDVFGAEGPPKIEIFTRSLVQRQPEADKSSFIAENAYTATKVRLHRKLREIITGEEVISNVTNYTKY